MNVLLVEDDLQLQELLKVLLEQRGHHVSAFSDAESAWEACQLEHFPMMILDWILPGMDGLELCRKVRDKQVSCDSLILVITIRNSASDLQQVMAAGADDYLAKPVDPDLLDIRLDIGEQAALHRIKAHETEKSLRENENRFRLAITGSGQGLWDWNIVTDTTYLSPKYYELMGYEEDEVNADFEFFKNLVHPDDWPTVMNDMEEHFHGKGEASILEYRMKKKNGDTVWINGIGQVVERDENGAPLRMMGIISDITQRKQLEQQMLDQEHILSESQRIAHVGSWSREMGSDVTEWSAETYRIYGLSADTFVPSPTSLTGLLHPDDQAKMQSWIQSCASGENPGQLEVRVIRPDGSIRTVIGNGQLEYDTDHSPIRMLGIVQDITVQKLAELALIAALNEAERANKVKSQFMARMSHELRTPLNAIIGFSELLEMKTRSTNFAEYDSVKYILTASYQLLGLINDVLDFYRMDINTLDFNIQPLSIADISSSCVNQVRVAMADKSGITIINNIANVAHRVEGDDLRLRQVLINLLSNAVKYNHENGTLTINCRIVDDGSCLRIEVSDTGIGIATNKLSLLFTPFERIDQNLGTIPGLGIGLHLSKQLVNAMHGNIGVESEQGKGSTFWFELPLVKEINEPTNKSTKAPRKNEQPVQNKNFKFMVLYIEDNAVNAQLVKTALKARPGIELIIANTAEEGMTIAEEKLPGLILMDMQLPGVDGITATKMLKKRETTKNIPVVALSANAIQADIDRALKSGCSAYLTKPLKIQALYELIDKSIAEIS